MAADRFIPMRDSLRAQLLWWLVPPVLVVVMASSYVSYAISLKFANDAYDEALFDGAKTLAEQVQIGLDGKPALQLPRAAEEMIRSDPVDQIFYRVLSSSGETIAGHSDLPAPGHPPNREQPVRYYGTRIDELPVQVCAYTIFDRSGAPLFTILIAETLRKRNNLSRNLLITDFLAPFLTLPVVMALIVWFGIRRGLHPLQRLTETLAKRGLTDLRAIGDQGIPREVRPLTHAIDSLMQRLEVAMTSQQRFIAEAAHQLRTPFAGLIAQTERALLENDIERMRPALMQLQAASQRAARLVNQLLSLARAEPGSGAPAEFRPVDLASLAQRTCSSWVPDALAKDVDLGYEGESGPVMIAGDELLLTEMLNNLIDNALRYAARPRSSITVRVTAAPRVELTVEDQGPGIPETERSRIFERFHRMPGSAPGGCGLGLAIVVEIARAHGAQVSTYANRPQGAVFRVVFG